MADGQIIDLEECGAHFHGRRRQLLKQFHDAKVHIVGVQEDRCPTSKIFQMNDYIVATSGSTPQGSHGNAAYICREWPTIDGRHTKLTREHMNIAHATPRVLYVTIRAGKATVDLLVAHCPTSGANVGDVRGLYERTPRCGATLPQHGDVAPCSH